MTADDVYAFHRMNSNDEVSSYSGIGFSEGVSNFLAGTNSMLGSLAGAANRVFTTALSSQEEEMTEPKIREDLFYRALKSALDLFPKKNNEEDIPSENAERMKRFIREEMDKSLDVLQGVLEKAQSEFPDDPWFGKHLKFYLDNAMVSLKEKGESETKINYFKLSPSYDKAISAREWQSLSEKNNHEGQSPTGVRARDLPKSDRSTPSHQSSSPQKTFRSNNQSDLTNIPPIVDENENAMLVQSDSERIEEKPSVEVKEKKSSQGGAIAKKPRPSTRPKSAQVDTKVEVTLENQEGRVVQKSYVQLNYERFLKFNGFENGKALYKAIIWIVSIALAGIPIFLGWGISALFDRYSKDSVSDITNKIPAAEIDPKEKS